MLYEVITVSPAEAAGGYAEDAGRHRFGAEQQQHPVHRAHEFHIRVAPAHALRNRQRLQCLLDQFRNHCGSRSAGFGRAPGQPGTLVGLQLLELGNGYTAGAGKTFSRFGRLAIGVEGGGQCRTAAQGLTVGLSYNFV